MVIDVTMAKPDANRIGHHIPDQHTHRFQRQIAKDVTIDREHKITLNESIVFWVYATWILRELLDIIVEIQAGVFIEDGE